MKRAAALTAAIVLSAVLSVHAGAQQRSDGVAQVDDDLLRTLEARYAQSMQAARRGDVQAFWATRTAAARKRPPMLDAARLRMLADMLPALDTLEFVRLDRSGSMVRTLYRWRKQDVAQYSVLVYRVEQGEWKLDEFRVKRSAQTRSVAGQPMRVLPLPPEPPPELARTDGQAQDLLRAWENAQPDPGRALTPPRL